jgi:flagellar M-ring protein FliF
MRGERAEGPAGENQVQQLRSVWDGLDTPRRALAIGAAVAVLAGMAMLARIAAAPSMALLYAGLEGPAAGQVIAALDQRGLRYEVRGDAIYVEAPARDATRMALASEGLPANSAAGYELLDGLSGFGTTAQMFDAAYWRAKEGELARTIVSSPHVRAARVHIAHGAGQPFRRDRQLSASVTVTPVAGALSPQQAHAFRFLVASAVAGLAPEDVSVIDTAAGLVAAEAPGASGGDRAAELRRNVERLLEARVGPGRAVVEVNVDTVTDRETIVERRIEPDSRIAVSTDTEERSANSTDSRTNGVSVASNLPDGEAAAGQGRAESREQQTRARTAYEVSQTSRELQRGPGAIRRLTVAVLIDGVYETAPDGTRSWAPRPEAELEALRELVASAVGHDPARGDVITLRSLPFEAVPMAGTGPGAGWIDRLGLDPMGLIRLAVLAMVILLVALFVLRPLLRPVPAGRPALPRPGLPPAGAAAEGLAGPVLSGVLTGEIAGPEGAATRLREVATAAATPPLDPVERMRALIAGRQTETLEILRGWMDERDDGRAEGRASGRSPGAGADRPAGGR